MNWSLDVEESILSTPNGVDVMLEAPVIKFLLCGGVGIVLLNLPGRSDNVIAYEADGKMKWRFVNEKFKGPFDGIWCKGDKISLYHGSGYSLLVDLATGKQLDIKFVK